MKITSYLFIFFFSAFCLAQTIDSTSLNMDAVYNRPFLLSGKSGAAVGGYLEANSNYAGSDGISNGLSFQIPRMTIFLSASINTRIKFLSELELEEGGSTLAIEFAAMDVEIHPLLNLRGGIIMNPIGAFNQNHDGPKWEFIERPLSATTIIPSTWSNVGFGLYGKMAKNQWVFAYEAYLSNGFDNTIISNSENRTWFAASKANTHRFEESFNGYPLTTLKVAVRNLRFGEMGVSWMGGIFNQYEADGLVLDQRRRADMLAIDFNSNWTFTSTRLIGEWVWAWVDVPATYSQQFGDRQKGGFIDIIQPIIQREIFNWPQATLNLATRIEYIDYNIGEFAETEGNIYDERFSIVPAISLRPSSETVFRFNYRLDWEQDLFGNPQVKTVSYQLGFSTYF